MNGWIQSAVLGVKVLDTAGDVRAHPTGKLGGLGLGERDGYESIQVVAGGNRELHGHFVSVNRGNLNTVDDVLRDISVRVGGFIASARNPVELAWVKANGAHGSISLAVDLGRDLAAAQASGADAAVEPSPSGSARRWWTPVHYGSKRTRTVGGWDRGVFRIGDHTVPYLNEYMAVDNDGGRVATYPDTIVILDKATGEASRSGRRPRWPGSGAAGGQGGRAAGLQFEHRPGRPGRMRADHGHRLSATPRLDP